MTEVQSDRTNGQWAPTWLGPGRGFRQPRSGPRFPFSDRMPIGWFHAEYSDQVGAGDVRPLEYFDRELVLFRDDEGDVHVLDAYCPHLGGHLGYGGVVEGDGIRCPFHEWKFDGEGCCTDVPYSDRVNKKARIPKFPTVERNGIIWVWHHPAFEPPAWDVPDVPEFADPEYTDYFRFDWKIRSSPQELGENQVDIAHFKYVHGTVVVPDLLLAEEDGPHMHVKTEHRFDTPIGPQPGSIESDSWGFGFAVIRFRGIVDTCLVTSALPVDSEYTHLKFSFMHKKLGEEKANSTVANALIADIRRQIVEDTPIWERKVWVETPALADTDGPFMVYRKWVKQFYADGETGGVPV